jgi:hypothetical protein
MEKKDAKQERLMFNIEVIQRHYAQAQKNFLLMQEENRVLKISFNN